VYRRIGRHLLFWLAYLLYIVIDQGWDHKDVWSFSLDPDMSTELPVAVLVVYANLYLVMPAYYSKRKFVHYAIGLVILLLIGGMIGRLFSWWLWLPRERLADPSSDEPTEYWVLARILKDAAQIFPVLAATVVLKLMRDSYQSERKLREIEKARFTAELGLLKAQINPHFFFNTLNSLYSLTLEGSKRSPDVVLRLSDLMRYMLYDASANKVPLQDDIKHLKNYIDIEQMRFSDRLDLSFQYSGDIEDKQIAPLILLPFIENAFKHGIEDASGWITIDLKVTGNRLFLKVENSYIETAKHSGNGLGLGNVRRRLELLYPGDHTLHIEKNNATFTVDLKMNV
jgi:two-component system LytT family sensor kinase